ncbi:hypothetical protein B9Z55_027107 [Caenorhabditis nigoni]|uniref:Uncharacterized protein n=1 Tax=Caenorhabditis nigoni TaxID=1611254 RepID=A0A2G5SJ80_9PELO|nr:hypothetical protein B9Z55_027107 [Caenorhabditis nigoni]
MGPEFLIFLIFLKMSIMRKLPTEIGIAVYWHIQGPEYEVMFPENKGTDRVFNENPEAEGFGKKRLQT